MKIITKIINEITLPGLLHAVRCGRYGAVPVRELKHRATNSDFMLLLFELLMVGKWDRETRSNDCDWV